MSKRFLFRLKSSGSNGWPITFSFCDWPVVICGSAIFFSKYELVMMMVIVMIIMMMVLLVVVVVVIMVVVVVWWHGNPNDSDDDLEQFSDSRKIYK